MLQCQRKQVPEKENTGRILCGAGGGLELFGVAFCQGTAGGSTEGGLQGPGWVGAGRPWQGLLAWLSTVGSKPPHVFCGSWVLKK